VTMQALNNYLAETARHRFKWGELDCLIFSNNAFHAIYGEGWCDDWIGRYMNKKTPKKHTQLKEEFGFDTLFDGVSSKLTRIDYIAPFGALVTAPVSRRYLNGEAFGISNGSKAIFKMNRGLFFYPLDKVSGAWIR